MISVGPRCVSEIEINQAATDRIREDLFQVRKYKTDLTGFNFVLLLNFCAHYYSKEFLFSIMIMFIALNVL